MNTSIDEALNSAERIEGDLLALLVDKDPTFRTIEDILAQFRTACEAVIFFDFEFATAKNVEARLWDAHLKINTRFRKNLNRFREGEGKKKIVEKRKLEKHYLEFIKSSQRFYRGYIQRLSVAFGNIPEIVKVAQKFKLNGTPQIDQLNVSPHLKQLVLLSCHQTLVRLGDLSRYRETELVTKGRNWGPATGYYELSNAIYPASGAAHNQLAVIALADSNHLRATYHLYRALAADQPHPTSKSNLEIEFKKIVTAWSKGELITNATSSGEGGAGRGLISWFLRLHAKCYKGQEFAQHEELESEVLSQLSVELKERSLEGTLHKFILINVAAQYFAGVRLQEAPNSTDYFQAFFFFLRLNVKTFFTLLRLLQPELEQSHDTVDDVTANGADGQASKEDSRTVTAVARRILPGLRQYSSWLVSNSSLLVAQVGDTSANTEIKEMWKIYASTLTIIATTFPTHDLPTVDYLLDEDEDTVCFKPFESDRAKRRYFIGNQKKPRWHDQGVERRHPNEEMLARVRDLLTDGLELALDDTIPIALIEGGRFVYQEDGVPSEVFASPPRHQAVPTDTRVDHGDLAACNGQNIPENTDAMSQGVTASESASASISMNAAMNHMVDELVGEFSEAPKPTKGTQNSVRMSGAEASSANDSTTYDPFGTLTGKELVNMMQAGPAANPTSFSPSQPTYNAAQNTPTPRPSLPSIWNSPFAPEGSEAFATPSGWNNYSSLPTGLGADGYGGPKGAAIPDDVYGKDRIYGDGSKSYYPYTGGALGSPWHRGVGSRGMEKTPPRGLRNG